MTTGKVDSREAEVIVLTPTGKDAALACRILAEAGIACRSIQELPSLLQMEAENIGALLIADEALNEKNTKRLIEWMETQPLWSDLPLLILVSNAVSAENLLDAFTRHANVSVLERPLHLTTFTSAVRVALSARHRQYETRDLLYELEAANRLKDEFLATLSHELRNPLNSILGNAEVLLRSNENRGFTQVLKSAEVIWRSARVQAQLVSDLLDLSRLQTGKLTINRQVLSLSTVIADTVETVQKEALEKNIELDVESGAEPLMIEADYVRTEQILWNLLNNAIKFTSDGGRIKLLLKRAGAEAVLQVKDNGQGIDPNFLPHIFDMFRQEDARTTRRHGGMGIGLALVRQLAELQGGRIEAASDGVGRGACFTLWFPLHQEARIAEPAIPKKKEGELKSLRILVVDDMPDAVEAMCLLLKFEGAVVDCAISGREALSLLKDKKFDLLISDVSMPEMDGYELIETLRRHPDGARIKAIALTGFGQVEDVERAIAAGFDSHLTKPIILEKLIKIIHATMDPVHPI